MIQRAPEPQVPDKINFCVRRLIANAVPETVIDRHMSTFDGVLAARDSSDSNSNWLITRNFVPCCVATSGLHIPWSKVDSGEKYQ
jgi:hypothetical protein